MYTAKIFAFILLFMMITVGVVALIFIMLATVGLRTIIEGLVNVPIAMAHKYKKAHP